MKLKITGLVLLSFSMQAHSVNVHIFDVGIKPSEYVYLQDRILTEGCYSSSGTDSISERDSATGVTVYSYKSASLCSNEQSRMRGPNAAIIRTQNLPGQRGGNFPPIEIRVDQRQGASHQALVGSTVKQLTSPSVKQWHTSVYTLFGANGGRDYAKHSAVNYGFSGRHSAEALEDFSRGTFLSRNGVRVVNMSYGFNTGYPTPCDSNPDITSSSDFRKIRDAIDRLNRQGVTVVAATRNHRGGAEENDNHIMPFPACLSGTVAVAAVDYSNSIRGAISIHTDFVHAGNGWITGTNVGGFGTSIAAPRVTAHLAELQTINPTLNQNQILNILRQSADVFTNSRTYGSKTINWRMSYPNFQRARNSTIDSFWNIFLNIPTDSSFLSGQFGWRYGTSEHQNGALSTFETIDTSTSNKVASKTSANTSAEQVMRYSFKLYDIDTPDELEIFVNDKSYGFAKTTSSNSLSSTRTICIDNADLKPLGERNEIQLKLKTSGETWGVTGISVDQGVVDNTCRKSPSSFPPLPSNPDRLVGSAQPVGSAYQLAKVSELPFTFNVNNNILPTPSTFTSKSLKRDIRVRFTTRSGNTSATDNGTQVLLNNSVKLTTPYFASDDERSYELIISRNDLASGNNVIKFKPRDNSTNALWGIRGISIEYIEPVGLSVGSNNGTQYGSNQSPTRFTGLRANFNLLSITNDYSLQVRGWDIDSSNEVQVFLNGASVGFLDVSANQNFNFGTNFTFPKASLRTGSNQIEFVQKASSDQWAVKDMMVSVLRPDIIPSRVNIKDHQLQSGEPFNVFTVVSNIGAGSSHATTLSYYVSPDKNINPASDALLRSVPLGSISANASVSVTNDMQSALVNQGYFLGVCLASVTNEANSGNNCSEGVALKSDVTIAPIIMLLLDE